MGNPESGRPTPEERGKRSDDIYAQMSKETREQLLALEPEKAAQREIVVAETREALEELHQGTIEDFVGTGLGLLDWHTSMEASDRAISKWGAEEE